MKTFFIIAAVLTAVLGVAWTLLPRPMLSSWGVEPDEVAVYMARRYGGLFFGYSIILWLGRASGVSTARTAILAGGAGVTTVMAIVSLVGALTGVIGRALWGVGAIEVLLSAGFVYFYVADGRRGRPSAS